MISFVNAKINLGLQIVNRRADGYHDLQTVFYPVGIYAGTPANPETFDDILEITPAPGAEGFTFEQTGRDTGSPAEKNLVWRAAAEYFGHGTAKGFAVSIRLDKHIPDGAGMGGGSADAAFTLRMLRDLEAQYIAGTGADAVPSAALPDDDALAAMALRLGADCPFFLLNRPAFAEGVGERLKPLDVNLAGFWLAVVKPAVSVSTREAFACVTPRPADFDLRRLPSIPIGEWPDLVTNDFEASIFPRYPEMRTVKDSFYDRGAAYASLTGSGSCIYGIFATRGAAEEALDYFRSFPTISESYLLNL